MKIFYKYILSVFTICLTLVQSHAQEDTDPKYFQSIQDVFNSELVYPQEKMEIQFTTAPEFQFFNNYSVFHLPFIVEYGISDSWQFELEWNSASNSFDDSGTFDKSMAALGFGTKYSFMNVSNSNFHTALGFQVDLPIKENSNFEQEGEVEYEPYVIMALDLVQLNNTQLFAHTGLSLKKAEENDFNGENDPETNEFFLNTGFFIPYKGVIFTSELNLINCKWFGGSDNFIYFTPGIVWNFSAAWEMGIGAPLGLNTSSSNYGFITMLTCEFNVSDNKD